MNQNQKPPKTAFEGTIDSVAGAVGLLWDWLGAEPKKSATATPSEPSILELIDSESEEAKTDPALPDAIDAEGKEV